MQSFKNIEVYGDVRHKSFSVRPLPSSNVFSLFLCSNWRCSQAVLTFVIITFPFRCNFSSSKLCSNSCFSTIFPSSSFSSNNLIISVRSVRKRTYFNGCSTNPFLDNAYRFWHVSSTFAALLSNGKYSSSLNRLYKSCGWVRVIDSLVRFIVVMRLIADKTFRFDCNTGAYYGIKESYNNESVTKLKTYVDLWLMWRCFSLFYNWNS